MGRPSVFPTGVTVFDPEKAYGGYTFYPSGKGAVIIDMNGRAVHAWDIMSHDIKMLPGGRILGADHDSPGRWGSTDRKDLYQLDWEGNIEWEYHGADITIDKDGNKVTSARIHHDLQREGATCGYGGAPLTSGGKTLLLAHYNHFDSHISDQPLISDMLYEVDWEKNIIWQWRSAEHFDEFDFDDAAKKAIYRDPCHGDWLHVNAASWLGENRWYDSGDERFKPQNIICSSRQTNAVFIVDHDTGRIVWRMGPDYTASVPMQRLGQLIGQHNAHMIPKGLPGAGNILVFDNGSYGGYGAPTSLSATGINNIRRHYSRAVEFNPVSGEVVWEYNNLEQTPSGVKEVGAYAFFSPFISGVQRLPNGNTLITEGSDGRVFEVTPEKEIVWEFLNPIPNNSDVSAIPNYVYRAYRIPYEWIPQLTPPEEVAVAKVDNNTYRVPGSFPMGEVNVVSKKERK